MLQPTSSHLHIFFVFWQQFKKTHQIWRHMVFTRQTLMPIIIIITSIIIGTLIYQTVEYCSELMKVLLLSVKFLVVSVGSFLPPLPPLLLLPLSPTTPMTQHLDAAPSNDHPAHCNDSQPASQEHTQRQNTFNLWFPAPQRDTLQYFFFLSLSLAGPIEQYLCLFSAVLHALSFPPLCLLLDVCVPSDKRHTSSQPFNLFICLIPSFLVVCHREITETETINRQLRRVLFLFKPAIKDIHHHQAIDNQALLSSFIP